MEAILQTRPIFVQKILYDTKFGIGLRLESRNLLFRHPLVSLVKIWKWFWKCALYLHKKLVNNTKIGIG